jgi:hypothetical protein
VLTQVEFPLGVCPIVTLKTPRREQRGDLTIKVDGVGGSGRDEEQEDY